MHSKPPSPRLRQLIDLHLDGEISRRDMAELEDAIRAPKALDYYLRTVETEAHLQEFHQTNLPEGSTVVPLNSTALPLVSSPTDDRRLLYASAAAIILLLAGLAIIQPSFHRTTEASPQSSDQLVAKVVRQVGPTQTGPQELRTGDEISFPPGLSEIQFESGTRWLLEGPAKLSNLTPNSARLEFGKGVIHVPYHSPKVTIDTPQGTISASNAEFALNIPNDGTEAKIGVFEGFATLDRPTENRIAIIERREALRYSQDVSLRHISFPFDSFHRRIPSGELAWSAPINSFKSTVIEHDLSGLIWKPGPYRAYFKWTHGTDALLIHSSELLCDGSPVAVDVHSAITGDPHHTRENSYQFTIPTENFKHGIWTLRTTIQTNPREIENIQVPVAMIGESNEIILADDPRVLAAQIKISRTLTTAPNAHGTLFLDHIPALTRSDFCDSWHYTHNGISYRREFFADGTARFYEHGHWADNFVTSTWTAKNGVLSLTIRDPQSGKFHVIERHMLRGKDTLVFLDRPYRDATRETGNPSE